MMNISAAPGKAFDCRETAERLIECVFLPNGGHGRTYEVEETRFAKRLRCPSVFRVVVRERDGGFVGYARIAEHCVAPECRDGYFVYSHPAVGSYQISAYTVDTLEGCNMRDGASRQDSGWYHKPRPANCLVPERSQCPEGCCEPSEGR